MTKAQTTYIRNELVSTVTKNVLEVYGINEKEVTFSLIFGSRAHGYSNVESDVDLLIVVQEAACLQKGSEYQRLDIKGIKVDSNCMSLKQLDEKCGDPAWAYRLYGAQPVSPYINVPKEKLNLWLKHLNSIIDSKSARFCRCRTHIQDLSKIKELLWSCKKHDNLSFYLMSEIICLMTFIVHELSDIIPFCTSPLNISLKKVASINKEYIRCFFNIFEYVQFNTIFPKIGNDTSIQDYRSFCLEGRSVVESVFPESKGYDHKYLIDHDWDDIKHLVRTFTEKYPYTMSQSDKCVSMINDFIKIVQKELLLEKTPHSRRNKESKVQKAKDNIIRHISYDTQTNRLKVILPTGGCTYSNCTFCMLPALAKNKADIEQIAETLLQYTSEPVNQLTLYTDGSFFDHQELSNREREIFADIAYKLNPKELLIESLPQFIQSDTLYSFFEKLHSSCHLRIAIGLQSINNEVRRHITRTPITELEFEKAVKLCHKFKISLRIYLLLGKPYLSIWEDIEDVMASIIRLSEFLMPDDIITVNPLLPTTGTIVEKIHSRGFFEYIRADEMAYAVKLINSLDIPQSIEFGPIQGGTCSSNHQKTVKIIDMNALESKTHAPLSLKNLDIDLNTFSLPWRLLGPLNNRISFTAPFI